MLVQIYESENFKNRLFRILASGFLIRVWQGVLCFGSLTKGEYSTLINGFAKLTLCYHFHAAIKGARKSIDELRLENILSWF